ncbi:ABC transporter permease [Yinghuangia soli]|uniref:ABC transporter permease n=1 Tax=Yinghuangia soli TaxID=2908204 RepID=A0AA41Q2J0_9ACTN|nr:ABC transporter permease [Yinghuangia soli]MCF2529551.1 ABC transporter permease [Yinghuangia soli]
MPTPDSRRGRRARGIEPSGIRRRDLAAEALAGVLQRPARSVLTMLGTVLGIGAFVAVLGLTATAGGQIDKRFDELSATQVTVADVGTGVPDDPTLSFPADADQRIGALNGVVAGGVFWPIDQARPRFAATPDADAPGAGYGDGIRLYAASPGALAAMEPTLRTGRTYDRFAESRRERVAVLGPGAARKLGITRLDGNPAVFVNGSPYTVVGIIADTRRMPELLSSVFIPAATAVQGFGEPVGPRASMIVHTRIGAARLIARQAPVALRPDGPQLFSVTPPPDPRDLREDVGRALDSLFLLLASVSLVIGAVGIANTTLVAVLERTPEIGLRRTLGARPRHIALQFLAESTALGTLGGLIGTSCGVAVVLATAVGNDWTAILEPWVVVPAPLIGSAVGLVAGLYPALRAARIEPADALRR